MITKTILDLFGSRLASEIANGGLMPESAGLTMANDLILLRRHQRLINEVFTRHGLSFREGLILVTLSEKTSSQRELAKLVDLHYSSVSQLVANCEEKGLLVQGSNESDARRKQVTLTDEGLEMVNSIKRAWQEEA